MQAQQQAQQMMMQQQQQWAALQAQQQQQAQQLQQQGYSAEQIQQWLAQQQVAMAQQMGMMGMGQQMGAMGAQQNLNSAQQQQAAFADAYGFAQPGQLAQPASLMPNGASPQGSPLGGAAPLGHGLAASGAPGLAAPDGNGSMSALDGDGIKPIHDLNKRFDGVIKDYKLTNGFGFIICAELNALYGRDLQEWLKAPYQGVSFQVPP